MVDDEYYGHGQQVLIVGHFPMAEEYESKPGLLVRNEYRMYELYYMSKRKTVAQTALWLEQMIEQKRIEVTSVPD
jgi:hypothetical protein